MPDVLLGGRPGRLIETWLSDADRDEIGRHADEQWRLQGGRQGGTAGEHRFMALASSAAVRLSTAQGEFAAANGLTWWEARRLIAAELEGRRGALA